MVGGGMRQAGVMAAAGMVALRDGPSRLADDHRRARYLGEIIEDLPGMSLASPVYSNLIFACWNPDEINIERFVDRANEQGLGIGMPFGEMMRIVTHHQVSDTDIEEAADIMVAASEFAALPSTLG